MDVLKWCDFSFHVENNNIIGVRDIEISVSVETENKTASNENYVTKKNLNPSEVSGTGIFSIALGVDDVQATAFQFVELCRAASKGYIYTGNGKLMPPQFMGTSAKINKIEVMPDGRWGYCEVPFTLKQAEKYDGGTKSSKKKKKKKKKNSVKNPGTTPQYPSSDGRKAQLQQAKETARQRAAAASSPGYTDKRYTGTSAQRAQKYMRKKP